MIALAIPSDTEHSKKRNEQYAHPPKKRAPSVLDHAKQHC